ncbi:MAG: lysine 5,6-aminomutase reactivase subunit KamB, partial [Promethearchaeota archaeon]
MDLFIDYFTKIETPKVISIIGLAKNVSKTTTLNYIIRNIKEDYILGLTSIGRDGEKYDVITDLPKPQIYIKKGTYVVTAKRCFEESEIKFDVIKNTDINTPLGEIMILKAQGEGYIELAGPSINNQLRKICMELKNLGCDLILVDGAFDRRSYSTPLISDATIISTGASVSRNMKEVIALTVHTIKLLNLEQEKDNTILNISKKIMKESKIGIISSSNSIKLLDVVTALDSARSI